MDDVNKAVNGNTISTPASVPAVEVHMGLDDPLGSWINLEADYDYKILEQDENPIQGMQNQDTKQNDGG